MKKYFNFHPPVDDIERRLIGINEGLIQAVERGETSSAIAVAVRCSPEWSQYQADKVAALAEPPSVGTEELPLPAMPVHIQELIRRRVAAQSIAYKSIPAAGQIVRIEKVVTPHPGQLDAVMMAPLYVLLDAPAENSAVWHGWLASGETDYAGWWDFVLQEDDAPFDPEAAMIQVWNPVRLYLPMAKRVVGVLSASRLQAVRALAAEFVSTEVPSNIAPWPGRVAVRTTTAGLRVVTGSPLGSAHDLRHRYQQVYFEAAEAVREPARLAMRALAKVPETQVGTFLNRFIVAASRLAECLVPEPRVAFAMRSEEGSAQSPPGIFALTGGAAVASIMDDHQPPDLLWPNIARLRLVVLEPDGGGSIEITAIGTEPVMAEAKRGSLVEEHFDIAPGDTQTLSWDRGSTTLALKAPTGCTIEIDLGETT
jgi:hypothetical protein